MVDALRGFALALIGIVHFMEQYLGDAPPEGVNYNQHGTADTALETVASILIRGKGFALSMSLKGSPRKCIFSSELLAVAIKPLVILAGAFGWQKTHLPGT